ncbi:MAG: site-2 protease family protein [Planctomycetales bacterium]|nr:site-2 protease family protein [Planctomycetales bacterium]
MDICLFAESGLTDALLIALNLGKAAIGLGFVIFVHELGHFAVAKMCGVKCEKFYVGFDVPIKIGPIRFPRSLARFQWGETEYGIGIIPLGGYVKMLGQDDDPRNAQREADRIRMKNEESANGGQVESSGAYELDPRSYPAKSVPARIAIISAGVIMNLIFAVLMAAVAFRVGVPYSPTIVGGTSPGDPAWTAGMSSMDRIMQIGEKGEPNPNLRWRWDLLQSVGEAGLSENPETIPMLVKKADSGERDWMQLTPSTRLKSVNGFATVGIIPLASTTMTKQISWDHVLPEDVRNQLQRNDRVVAVAGQTLDRSMENWEGDIPDVEYGDRMFALRAEPVKLTFARPKNPEKPRPEGAEQFDVTLAPRPYRTLGLVMTIGPVVGVQKGSPAEAAGVQAGDVLQAINGEPVDDPLRLPERVAELGTQDITLQMLRGEGEAKETVEVTLKPRKSHHQSRMRGHGDRVALEPLGLAYDIGFTVKDVVAGSPAEKAGLKPGDTIEKLEFHAADEAKRMESATKIDSFWYGPEGKEVNLREELFTWFDIHQHMQDMLPDTEVKLFYTRDGKSETATLAAVDADAWFNPDRGLLFQVYDELHQVDSLVAAFPAAIERTKQELGRVAAMLKKLFTGKVSPKHLGGPIAIATVAGSEAAQGVPQLMMFLVFLSANLAILNFLPIPALDGGHLVFLLWEGITGKPADERVQGTLTLIGVTCLLGLILFVSLNDVGKLFFSS